MTVKEVISVLKEVEELRLGWNGTTQEFDPADALFMDAFGDYVVGGLYATGDGRIEIALATKLVKAV